MSKRIKLGPPARRAPEPKTDFEHWSAATWECYGDADGHKCEVHWKAPHRPDRVCTEDDKAWLLRVLYPRVLAVLFVVVAVKAFAGPWHDLWMFLTGAALTLLVVHVVTHM